jgi:hypothetical protein
MTYVRASSTSSALMTYVDTAKLTRKYHSLSERRKQKKVIARKGCADSCISNPGCQAGDVIEGSEWGKQKDAKVFGMDPIAMSISCQQY